MGLILFALVKYMIVWEKTHTKPSSLDHIISVQIIKLNKNYKNFKWGG